MDIRFDGKRALVTGAGKGVGRRVTTKLVELGAEVVAVSRTATDLDELSETSPNIKTICLDVGNWEATKIALEDVGDIDLLVNNAGIVGPVSNDNLSEEDIDECYNINIKSYINIGMMIANQMKKRGKGGSIVNVSSMDSMRGLPMFAVYSTSKSAVDQLTRCMASQFGSYDIRVNAVSPTVIRTRMSEEYFDPSNELAKQFMERTPLRRFAEIEEIVDPILFLLSEKASMITGITLPVDGGIINCF